MRGGQRRGACCGGEPSLRGHGDGCVVVDVRDMGAAIRRANSLAVWLGR